MKKMSKSWKREPRGFDNPKQSFRQSEWEKRNQEDYKEWQDQRDDLENYDDEYEDEER